MGKTRRRREPSRFFHRWHGKAVLSVAAGMVLVVVAIQAYRVFFGCVCANAYMPLAAASDTRDLIIGRWMVQRCNAPRETLQVDGGIMVFGTGGIHAGNIEPKTETDVAYKVAGKAVVVTRRTLKCTDKDREPNGSCMTLSPVEDHTTYDFVDSCTLIERGQKDVYWVKEACMAARLAGAMSSR